MPIEQLYSGINETKTTSSFVSSESFSQLVTVKLQYSGIKITKQCSDVNCMRSIRIRGYSGPHYATF